MPRVGETEAQGELEPGAAAAARGDRGAQAASHEATSGVPAVRRQA